MSKKFAVFDVDGTFIRWQLFHVIIDRLAKQGMLGTTVYDDIRSARMKWKQRRSSDEFQFYEDKLFKSFVKSLAGVNYDDYLAIVKATLDEYLEQTYIYTRDLANQLKQQGYALLMISGSPVEALELLAKHYGFDDFDGFRGEVKNGKFTGKYTTPMFDKNGALDRLVQKHGLSYADSYGIGDTKTDAAILAATQHPIAFNPSGHLLAEAKRRGWPVVIERKDVIYKLAPSGKIYQLQNADYKL
ncbi:HAD family phosphatase [Candidatus Saccharibacteria bacterium]|nr:HAD family phosphatase [Candidatus Saccharibacteria bacterium]